MKKFLSLLLLASMLLLAVSCGSGETPATTQAAETTAGGEVTTEVTTEPGPDLPDSDFGGYVFRSVSRGHNAGSTHWYIFDTVYLEEKAGDIVNDEVLLRNQTLEEKYNFTIQMIDKDGADAALSMAKSSIMAGSDDFDIYGDSISTAAQLAVQGYLVDMHTIPYIDLDAKWWDQGANEQLSLKKRLYMTVSDFTLMDKHGTWVTLFNKPMIGMYSFDNPYDMVNNGTWTSDKMYEMAQVVSFDVDGDGKMTEFDSWGTVGENWNVNALMVGANVRMFTKNADDIPECTLEGEKQIKAFEKAYRIINDKNITLFAANVTGSYSDKHVEGLAPAMEDNRALFYITGMNRVLLLRGMETDFGIIPNPKYDEAQEHYSTILTYGNTNSVSVPVTNTDLERTGIILEAITYESSKTSYPAYIETSIKTKYSRDEDSIAMLDLIFSNRTYDLGIIFNWGSCSSFYTGLLTASPDYASTAAKNVEKYVSEMQKTLDLLDELN